jgi:alkanesulfonate monooxygenase SsuD/methylene tetrahydromethanopterin reductase-like flavin-dependent oxidoreductase (luciferase family)
MQYTRLIMEVSLKYAVYLPTFTPYADARLIASLAQEAEEAGWDGFFVWDDVAGYEDNLADPWISLTAAAVSTTRIRLGALITPLARRRPWKVARETATLDRLSDGRLVYGVGSGGGQEQFGDLGDEPDPKRRGDMLDEGLEVLTGLWSGESFEFNGQFYHIKKTRFLPTPLQTPRIPIWVAGRWPNQRPLRRMARWDGMFPLSPDDSSQEDDLDHLRQTVASVRALRGEDPRPFDVIATGVTPLGRPQESAAITEKYARVGATWWLESLAPQRNAENPADLWPFEKLRQKLHEGPPQK